MEGRHVLVMAKSPAPGRVKTRLCPPCTPIEAAALAEAALADTLGAVTRCGADRRIVALDGPPGPWLPPGFEVIRQTDGGLDRRLAHAWNAAGGPGVQIGMDTPQVTPGLLDSALSALDASTAALGPALDGGWWAIALRRPDPAAFLGLAMSTKRTGWDQWVRLETLGHHVALLPALVDLDRVEDLPAVISSGAATRTALLAYRLGLVPVPALV
ncbi:MAG: DUF2064 domain-containing protein [Acidimicrobiales bacterium]